MRPAAGTLARLHVVTDDTVLARSDFQDRAGTVLETGSVVALHLRGPRTAARTLHELACWLVPRARASGATLLVNDRVDVALAAEADGAHLGRRSLPVAVARALLLPGALVGASVHDAVEAAGTRAGGADYLMVGTVFATPSHPGLAGASPDLLGRVAAVTDAPLVAIGGVTPERVAACLEAGAHGVAALRGVWEVADTAGALAGYLERLHLTGGAPAP